MTAADSFGNVVATTQTINNLFGAKFFSFPASAPSPTTT
jgi:gamma-glutamyltranspeptidase